MQSVFHFHPGYTASSVHAASDVDVRNALLCRACPAATPVVHAEVDADHVPSLEVRAKPLQHARAPLVAGARVHGIVERYHVAWAREGCVSGSAFERLGVCTAIPETTATPGRGEETVRTSSAATQIHPKHGRSLGCGIKRAMGLCDGQSPSAAPDSIKLAFSLRSKAKYAA